MILRGSKRWSPEILREPDWRNQDQKINRRISRFSDGFSSLVRLTRDAAESGVNGSLTS
jgi:hypothetical protein